MSAASEADSLVRSVWCHVSLTISTWTWTSPTMTLDPGGLDTISSLVSPLCPLYLPSPPSFCPLSSSSPVWRTLFSPKWNYFVSWVAWLLQRLPQLWVGDWIRTWTLHQNHIWQVGGIILWLCIIMKTLRALNRQSCAESSDNQI